MHTQVHPKEHIKEKGNMVKNGTVRVSGKKRERKKAICTWRRERKEEQKYIQNEESMREYREGLR